MFIVQFFILNSNLFHIWFIISNSKPILNVLTHESNFAKLPGAPSKFSKKSKKKNFFLYDFWCCFRLKSFNSYLRHDCNLNRLNLTFVNFCERSRYLKKNLLSTISWLVEKIDCNDLYHGMISPVSSIAVLFE